ncbi:hypothetical protein BCR32DRAFT_275188 [Anaeromyces robustus]|uniref:Uncharacterized protein n=1 Tax=Anaeromyces robustus TaxID=1754192 RepID=A0A1Y1XLR5_9FUNG|nr:hypothetical protein BCR32DRAFT_275188 [Anaeromyces robustus]|eukprot:ORX86688.1 hypothetical protein BCR32DRAFT_275188 [Anaeromyces robustus]
MVIKLIYLFGEPLENNKNIFIKTCITEKLLFFLDSMKIKNDINIANNRYYNLNFTDNYILAPVYNNKVNLKNQCITMTHTHINKFIQDYFYYRINDKETPDVTNFLNNIKINRFVFRTYY